MKLHKTEGMRNEGVNFFVRLYEISMHQQVTNLISIISSLSSIYQRRRLAHKTSLPSLLFSSPIPSLIFSHPIHTHQCHAHANPNARSRSNLHCSRPNIITTNNATSRCLSTPPTISTPPPVMTPHPAVSPVSSPPPMMSSSPSESPSMSPVPISSPTPSPMDPDQSPTEGMSPPAPAPGSMSSPAPTSMSSPTSPSPNADFVHGSSMALSALLGGAAFLFV